MCVWLRPVFKRAHQNLCTQGLLKVAVENARAQDKQIQAEKRELKMELYREREMRESLERQLTSELQSRGWSSGGVAGGVGEMGYEL